METQEQDFAAIRQRRRYWLAAAAAAAASDAIPKKRTISGSLVKNNSYNLYSVQMKTMSIP